jgi:multicomponent Na+:H+ antiporter subunit B
MSSVILATISRLLAGLLLIFSIFLLLRGHNLPGGGFAGGLVAASAVVLHALASGFPEARRMLWIDPRTLMALGLLVALGSGLAGMVGGWPFLTGLWDKTPLPVVGKIGTPLVFDCGVYLVVLGVTCLIVFSLGEDGEGD